MTETMNHEVIDREESSLAKTSDIKGQSVQLDCELKSRLKVIANAHLEIIAHSSKSLLSLNECIAELKEGVHPQMSHSLTWTTKKAYLIELIYALQEVGAFNNGIAGVKQIACLFENLFHVSLGNCYRHCVEIRKRKNGKNIIIDMMKARLEQRLDDLDGKI